MIVSAKAVLPAIFSGSATCKPASSRVNFILPPPSSPTLPILTVAYKGPAYTDTAKDSAALDALAYLAFSPNSDLYQKLVVQEQKVDNLDGGISDHVDPSLFGVTARVKSAADIAYIRSQILATVKEFQDKPVDSARLDAVKKNLRYGFALRMDNSENVAAIVARFVALRRTPATIDRIYGMYAGLTPQDVLQAARRFLTENNRTEVTLTGKQSGGSN